MCHDKCIPRSTSQRPEHGLIDTQEAPETPSQQSDLQLPAAGQMPASSSEAAMSGEPSACSTSPRPSSDIGQRSAGSLHTVSAPAASNAVLLQHGAAFSGSAAPGVATGSLRAAVGGGPLEQPRPPTVRRTSELPPSSLRPGSSGADMQASGAVAGAAGSPPSAMQPHGRLPPRAQQWQQQRQQLLQPQQGGPMAAFPQPLPSTAAAPWGAPGLQLRQPLAPPAPPAPHPFALHAAAGDWQHPQQEPVIRAASAAGDLEAAAALWAQLWLASYAVHLAPMVKLARCRTSHTTKLVHVYVIYSCPVLLPKFIRPQAYVALSWPQLTTSFHACAGGGAGEFVCDLCSVRVSGSRNMAQHLSSARHLRRAASAARGIAAAAAAAHGGQPLGGHPAAAGQPSAGVPLDGGGGGGGAGLPIGDYCQQVRTLHSLLQLVGVNCGDTSNMRLIQAVICHHKCE